ncbi:hypothetical protein PG987_005877 [Apiospora arundinis]
MVERVQHQAEQQLAVALEAAGKWLVHLCQKEGALGREFTPLEEEKFNEFFELYGHLEDFKHHHAQAVHCSLLGEDYRLVQRLLAKDDTHQVLQHDPFAIQAAIKPVPPGSHRSLKRSLGTLAPKLDLVDIVKLLVHHGAVINSQDQEWNPPLFYACRLGNAYLFKFLYESGADLSVSIRRRVPIRRRTYSEAEAEADSKTGDETGNEAQHEVNLLQITLDAFMYIVHTSPVRSCFHDDPTGWDDEYDRRKEDEFYHWRLDLKATWGAIILDLVHNGLECALDDPGLIKLLHVSCYQGELDFVTVLLDFGASIDVASTSSYLKVQYGSALHAAASKWQVPVAQKLLQHGADPCILRPCRPTSFWSGWGCATPSLNSAWSQELTPMGLALIELLEFCVNHNRLDFIRWILQRGVRPAEMPDTNSLEVILLLLEEGVEVVPQIMQRRAISHTSLAILRWSVSQHGGQLPSDPKGWSSIALAAIPEFRPLNYELLKFIIYEYPGPHIDMVLEKSWYTEEERREKSVMTSLLQLSIERLDLEAIRIILNAGADPRCPGLPENGLELFHRTMKGPELHIGARLYPSDLTHHPRYEALSYVWGDPSMENVLFLDGYPVSITENLHLALTHLRHETGVRRLWVDALCIDQNSISERNHQVRIMGDIYRRANAVLVWLGEAADDSNLVFERISELAPTRFNWPLASTVQFDQAWRALITRPWFFRTWVIQEVALNSSKAIAMCGYDSVPWEDLLIVGDYLFSNAGWGSSVSGLEINVYHPLGGVNFGMRIAYPERTVLQEWPSGHFAV